MEWYPVDLSLRERHAACWEKTPVHTADCTFTNLWGWAENYGLQWKEAHGLLWLRRTRCGGEPLKRGWMPLGDWEAADWNAVLADIPPGTVWERVPESLCARLLTLAPDRIRLEETPEQWEYLYDAAALSSLAGNRLHRKRNHVNGYVKTHGEDYRELGPQDVEELLLFEYDWCKYHECEKSPALIEENEAILRVLTRWEQLPGLKAAGLFADGRMTAFSVGEALDAQTLVVHFEKGRPEYRGVYQAMNMFFVRHAGAGFALVNREQDAGEEGLRKAKRSYYPCGFVKKDRLVFVQ